MKIKIEIQNKFYIIWLKGKIEKKINLAKWQKNQKNKDQNRHRK
jgi:hypothetical protein